jgi:hypothetical protein
MLQFKRLIIAAGVTTGFVIFTSTMLTMAQPANDPHLPIPPGFDFPADRQTLLKLRDTNDVAGMRKHAWMVFAGMTKDEPGGGAIWETWWPADVTLSPGAVPQGAGRLRPPFKTPRQFVVSRRGAAEPQAVGESGLSFVMFNPAAHKFIRDNRFHMKSQLDLIRAGGAPDIEPFPAEAMSLKTLWWPIKKGGLSPLPVWDAEPTKPIDSGFPTTIGNNFPTWKRIVAIDPSRESVPEGETATVKFFDPAAANPLSAQLVDRPNSKVVPLKRLYHYKLTEDDIQQSRVLLNNVFRRLTGRDAEAGDYVALVNLHYTTKEIDDWVWATFWWHDKPDDGVFGANRPAEVLGTWRNYLMNVAFSMDTPKEEDGHPKIAYNPWLEARFPNGVMSNCMTCHQRSTWPQHEELPVPFLPVTRGSMKLDDPFFKNRTRLDFLWSIGDSAAQQQ